MAYEMFRQNGIRRVFEILSIYVRSENTESGQMVSASVTKCSRSHPAVTSTSLMFTNKGDLRRDDSTRSVRYDNA